MNAGPYIPPVVQQAWDVYKQEGSQKRAAKRLRCCTSTLRTRLNTYTRLTGEERPKPRERPPATLTDKHVAAWEALARLNNYEAVAEELGIHYNTVSLRLRMYRKHMGLPKDARPKPMERTCYKKPTASRVSKLDALLDQLEQAKASGDDERVRSLRATMHRLEEAGF